ncbi:MAG: hypothetical protein Ct9H300mP13_4280 [Gammaproteobacteria bacterium]|nr:MAG: hypothetical protein Ct9H300mP13_4280 [Gammaproteobacteria bacterium]
MPYVTTDDDVQLYYEGAGSGTAYCLSPNSVGITGHGSHKSDSSRVGIAV